VWKSLFAARLAGIEIEITGAKPAELSGWLWDVEPRPLETGESNPAGPLARRSRRGFSTTLYKTDAFLAAHPFGTVPAAFVEGENGPIGVFESNSILRAVARVSGHPTLYGQDAAAASRIDSFLDAALVFAREAQVYLLALQDGSAELALHARMTGAYDFYMSGIESALSRDAWIAGNTLTIADLSFACDLAQFLREGHYDLALGALGCGPVSRNGPGEFPRAFGHLFALSEQPELHELARYLRGYRARLANGNTEHGR